MFHFRLDFGKRVGTSALVPMNYSRLVTSDGLYVVDANDSPVYVYV